MLIFSLHTQDLQELTAITYIPTSIVDTAPYCAESDCKMDDPNNELIRQQCASLREKIEEGYTCSPMHKQWKEWRQTIDGETYEIETSDFATVYQKIWELKDNKKPKGIVKKRQEDEIYCDYCRRAYIESYYKRHCKTKLHIQQMKKTIKTD